MTASKSRRDHTMRVDESSWKWACAEYGVEKPGRFLNDLIHEAIRAREGMNKIFPTFGNENWPEINYVYKKVQEGGHFNNLVDLILKSDWDYTDSLMRADPDLVRGFLESLALHGRVFEDLTPGQKRLLGTIVDGYNRSSPKREKSK